MKEYHWSKEYVLTELDMITGLSLCGFSIANDPINRFGGIQMKYSPAQKEAVKLLEDLKKFNNMI